MNDTEYNKLSTLHTQRENLRSNCKKRYGKNNVLKTVMKSINTTMIGALSDFEKSFGAAWGHGKNINELTKEQIDMRKLWNEVRDSILDRGNSAIKICTNELNKCDVVNYDKRNNYSIRSRR